MLDLSNAVCGICKFGHHHVAVLCTVERNLASNPAGDGSGGIVIATIAGAVYGTDVYVFYGDDEFSSKSALIFDGFWAGVGGGNMILYLAAIVGVPPELYEAARIDGASRWRQFVDITWPMIAPTTFFIFVMGTIGGLQGGFEMAFMMTNGDPEDSTVDAWVSHL